MKDGKSSQFTAREILLKGSLIALILTGSSLSTFAIAWFILDDLFMAIIISGIVYLIMMIFSLKILKKLFSHDSKSNKVL